MINRGQPKTCRVMLCCNDEHGGFAGRVTALEVEDEIRIVSVKLSGAALSFWIGRNGLEARIIRRKFDCFNRRVCVGNVFWDSVAMSIETARELVSYLLANGWDVEEHAEQGPFADLAEAA